MSVIEKYYPKIAFYGVSGSGKDYCVKALQNYFESNHKESYIRMSFSDQLKKCGNRIFGDWLKLDYSPEEKEQPLNIATSLGEVIEKSPRDIWLLLNQLRSIEDKLFIRMLDQEIKDLELQGKEMFLISDIRTEKELKYCKENGFKVIKIMSSKPFHPSNDFDKQQEMFLPETDFIFLNQKDNFNLKLLLSMIKE